MVSLGSKGGPCFEPVVDLGATGVDEPEIVDDEGEASVLALLPKPNSIERKQEENGGHK